MKRMSKKKEQKPKEEEEDELEIREMGENSRQYLISLLVSVGKRSKHCYIRNFIGFFLFVRVFVQTV